MDNDNDTEKVNEKGEDMKKNTLYGVVVVSEDEEILLDTKVVADGDTDAGFVANVNDVIRKAKLKPKNVTVLYRRIGEVKVKEEPATVQIVKEA